MRDKQSGQGRVVIPFDKLLQWTNRAAMRTCRYICARRVKREGAHINLRLDGWTALNCAVPGNGFDVA
jgi:hypothetical protein